MLHTHPGPAARDKPWTQFLELRAPASQRPARDVHGPLVPYHPHADDIEGFSFTTKAAFHREDDSVDGHPAGPCGLNLHKM